MEKLMYNPDPICPHCGAKQPDHWEFEMSDGETIERWCETCNEKMMVHCHVDISYDTWPCGMCAVDDAP